MHGFDAASFHDFVADFTHGCLLCYRLLVYPLHCYESMHVLLHSIDRCATMLLSDLSYLRQHSVGFSGVIFALAVVDIYKSGGETRQVLGLFSVPAKVYPWVLLVVLQASPPVTCLRFTF